MAKPVKNMLAGASPNFIDEEVITEILCRLKNNEELEGVEARLRCKDGTIRCVTLDLTDQKHRFINEFFEVPA